MNRKSVIILLSVALALIAVIAAGVVSLYSGKGAAETSRSVPQTKSVLLKAVPSDAALVSCFRDLRHATSFFVDPRNMFSPVFSRTASSAFKAFVADLESGEGIRTSDVCVSLHYSGTMEPLMIIDGGRASADTLSNLGAIAAAASQRGLESSIASLDSRQILLVSGNSTLVSSSLRHISSRSSILDNKQFSSAVDMSGTDNVIYASNLYAPRLLSGFFGKEVSRYSSFVKDFADWTSLKIDAEGDYALSMSIVPVCGNGGAYSSNMLSSLKAGELRLASVLPAGTSFALALALADGKTYEDAFRRYLDANMLLQKRQSRCEALKAASGVSPAQWAADCGVCEVGVISWKSAEAQYSAVLFRGAAAPEGEPEVKAYDHSGYAAAQFGSVFSVPDETCFAQMGEWTVSGSEAAVTDFLSAVKRDESAAPLKNCTAAVFFPSVRIVAGDGPISLEARRVSTLYVASSEGLVIDIPKGPFKVTNSATGRKNILSQSENLSLSLAEENGKGIWAIPFGEPLAGSVAEVDNYKNGKIQFLFAAGSKLYLLDRLGRFCGGFPVELGKKVLLGPVVYDFSGAKNYSVMVLHDDNTLGMYNIKGQKLSSWKGITGESPITALPELKTVEGQKYWIVKTVSGTLAYEFDGGEPLKGKVAKNVLKLYGISVIKQDALEELQGKLGKGCPVKLSGRDSQIQGSGQKDTLHSHMFRELRTPEGR